MISNQKNIKLIQLKVKMLCLYHNERYKEAKLVCLPDKSLQKIIDSREKQIHNPWKVKKKKTLLSFTNLSVWGSWILEQY